MIVVYVTDLGEVVGHCEAPETSVFPPAPTGAKQILVSSLPEPSTYYDGGDFVKIPQPTDENSIWDWEKKSWRVAMPNYKNRLWLKVKAQRDAQEFGPFTWNTHTFDGDPKSQSRISLAAQAAQAALLTGNTTWSVEWTLADNTSVALNAEDMIAVTQAMGDNINQAYTSARTKRALIDAATTVEELDAIDLTL